MNRSESRWLEQIRRRGDGVQGQRVLVACSGGGDSMALLAFLWSIRKTLDLELAVAHVDHGLRTESAQDAEFVSQWARELDLDYVETRLDVRAHAQANQLGLEMAARELRWQWLRTEAQSMDATVVATGHSLDDHTETVLMRLARGSGLGALSPLPARQDLRWSPLIQARRTELRTYLKAKGLEWCEDPTNTENFTSRNRWRKLLVDLRQEASALDIHLWETHQQVAELRAFRDAQVQLWRGLRWDIGNDGIELRGAWTELELRLVLDAAFLEAGWKRESDLLKDLAAWMIEHMPSSKSSLTWGNWRLSRSAEGWRLEPFRTARLVLRRAREATSSAAIYEAATAHMLAQNILQWDARYPNLASAQKALERGDLHIFREGTSRRVVGTVTLNTLPNPGYEAISWQEAEPALVIHGLALDPAFQGQGYGKASLSLIQTWAKARGYRSLRLDAYPGNAAAMGLYTSFGFEPRGFIRFEGIKPTGHETYLVMEKRLAAK